MLPVSAIVIVTASMIGRASLQGFRLGVILAYGGVQETGQLPSHVIGIDLNVTQLIMQRSVVPVTEHE